MRKTVDIWVAACDFEAELSVILSFDKDDLYNQALEWAIDDLYNENASAEDIETLEELINNKKWSEAIDFWRDWVEAWGGHSYMEIYKRSLAMPTDMQDWWHIWGDF